MIIHSTYRSASTDLGTATGTEEKNPGVEPGSDGVLMGG